MQLMAEEQQAKEKEGRKARKAKANPHPHPHPNPNPTPNSTPTPTPTPTPNPEPSQARKAKAKQEEAAKAYDSTAVKWAGPRAVTNFPAHEYGDELRQWSSGPDRSAASEAAVKKVCAQVDSSLPTARPLVRASRAQPLRRRAHC